MKKKLILVGIGIWLLMPCTTRSQEVRDAIYKGNQVTNYFMNKPLEYLNSVIFVNGHFIWDTDGYIKFINVKGEKDSILLFQRAGMMEFVKDDLDKLFSCSDTTQLCIQFNLRTQIPEGKAHYITNIIVKEIFPLSLFRYDREKISYSIYLITILNENDYLMTLLNGGIIRNTRTVQRLEKEKKLKKLLKKEEKYYFDGGILSTILW